MPSNDIVESVSLHSFAKKKKSKEFDMEIENEEKLGESSKFSSYLLEKMNKVASLISCLPWFPPGLQAIFIML